MLLVLKPAPPCGVRSAPPHSPAKMAIGELMLPPVVGPEKENEGPTEPHAELSFSSPTFVGESGNSTQYGGPFVPAPPSQRRQQNSSPTKSKMSMASGALTPRTALYSSTGTRASLALGYPCFSAPASACWCWRGAHWLAAPVSCSLC